jgi:hypothetical protein
MEEQKSELAKATAARGYEPSYRQGHPSGGTVIRKRTSERIQREAMRVSFPEGQIVFSGRRQTV